MANNLVDRVQRLKTMSLAELADRTRQYICARRDWLLYRLGHDFTRDRKIGSAESLGKFFFTSKDLPVICSIMRRDLPDQVGQIISQANRIREHRFDLLDYRDLDYGRTIDWHLDIVHGKQAPRIAWFKVRYLDFEQVGDSKITWELNRHQHFVTLAKAYLLTGDEGYVCEVLAQWNHWWSENPYPLGLNWASTLEVAFRVQSWIWTFFLLQDCPAFTTETRQRWIEHLLISGRHIENYLSTYFSPNTHLLGEALILFFLGTLFPSQSAHSWQEKGWGILTSEASKQTREDGFYFEQSSYYHVYALDMLLHARILAGVNGVTIPPEFSDNLRRMLDALLLLGRAGAPHMFGDDDGGRLFDPRRNQAQHMLDPLATGVVLFSRGDYKHVVKSLQEETLWLLGAEAAEKFESLPHCDVSGESTALSASGFYLMTDDLTPGKPSKQQMLVDAGPLGAGSGGHGHADALSLSLIRNGRVLLRDSGTFEYVGPGRDRTRLRSTGAHNTVQIDGRNQTEPVGPFSWSGFPEAKVERWINGKRFDLFQGWVRYAPPLSTIVHRREIFHPKGNLWFVRDLVEGAGEHEVEIAWHIGPGLKQVSSGRCLFADGEENLELITSEGHGWSTDVAMFDWSPVYGKMESAHVVRFSANCKLPVEFVTVVRVGDRANDHPRLVKSSDATENRWSCFQYCHDEEDSTCVFGNSVSPWNNGSWRSDAAFFYAYTALDGRACNLVLCDGSYVEAGGKRVLSCERKVRYVEVWSSADGSKLSSSDPNNVRLEEPLSSLWNNLMAVPKAT